MWIVHIPTKDEGAYIESANDMISVWSIKFKKVVDWNIKDTEIVLDSKTDDFSTLLKVMVSEHGKNAFKPDHILVTCLDSIKWYLEHENLHARTIDERLQIMQEVLYYAAGKEFELGAERDRLILFIHNTLPHLMIGSIVGFKLAKEFYLKKKPLFDPLEESHSIEESVEESIESKSETSESDTDEASTNQEPFRRKRFCWC